MPHRAPIIRWRDARFWIRRIHGRRTSGALSARATSLWRPALIRMGFSAPVLALTGLRIIWRGGRHYRLWPSILSGTLTWETSGYQRISLRPMLSSLLLMASSPLAGILSGWTMAGREILE